MSQYLHFIGGKYTPDRFIAEAQKYGVTRRISFHQTAGMEFGDIVTCLYKRPRGTAIAFCEFRIRSITFEGDLTARVAEKISEKYKMTPSQSAPQRVERACGSYATRGGYSTDAPLEEILKVAKELSGGEPIWAMIGGRLSAIFSPPIYIEQPFFRGFANSDYDFRAYAKKIEESAGTNDILIVNDYRRRTRKNRTDRRLALAA